MIKYLATIRKLLCSSTTVLLKTLYSDYGVFSFQLSLELYDELYDMLLT